MTGARVEFDVAGQPVPKQSFRVARHGRRVAGYKTDAVSAWEGAVAYAAQPAATANELMTGDLEVRAEFRLKDHRRVDLDNLWKPVADACNLRLWLDDRQIVKLTLEKAINRADPGVHVTVMEV